MSNEKGGDVVDETSHGISSAGTHYPIVAEGTGKTLDAATGAKAKEVHNVSTRPCMGYSSTPACHVVRLAETRFCLHQVHLPGRVIRRRPGVSDREMEQELVEIIRCCLHSILLCLCQRL